MSDAERTPLACVCGEAPLVERHADHRDRQIFSVWCVNLMCYPPRCVSHADRATAIDKWDEKIKGEQNDRGSKKAQAG